MPSITYWNRLEPRPRAPSLTDTLAARIRDPLWMLTRQWQVGEFHGEDAASPAYLQLRGISIPLGTWRAGGVSGPLDGRAPLEVLIEREAFPSDDLSLQVELWHTFTRLLRAQPGLDDVTASAIIDALTASGRYQLAAPDAADRDATRFYLVCGARALNGARLLDDARIQPPVAPPGVALPSDAARDALFVAFAGIVDWVRTVFGDVGHADGLAWRADRLSYEASVFTTSTAGAAMEFSVHPGLDAGLDWPAFDLAPNDAGGDDDIVIGPPRGFSRSILPAHVRFRGMPNARWWDFENGVADFGAITPDTTDLAKIVLMDFMLVQGNDWFVIPLQQKVGTLTRIETVLVRDVFGGTTLVERTDAGIVVAGARWTMYTTSAPGVGGALGDFLLIPPSVSTIVQTGGPIEEVHFLRDELANLAWAVEHTVPNGIGHAWSGPERGIAESSREPGLPALPLSSGPPLRYRVQTEVPQYWIPFLPVAIDPLSGEIALERGAILDPRSNPPAAILPRGRILRPTSIGNAPYRIREEEIARAGVHVIRRAFRSRWIDGSTHLWIARERRAGAGEGSSGLQFDIAEKNVAEL